MSRAFMPSLLSTASVKAVDRTKTDPGLRQLATTYRRMWAEAEESHDIYVLAYFLAAGHVLDSSLKSPPSKSHKSEIQTALLKPRPKY